MKTTTKTEFKQTEVGMIPEGWEVKPVSEFCSKITSGGTPSRNKKGYWEHGTIPWLKTQELNDTKIHGAEEKITKLGLDNSSAKIFPVNTILMAMYGATVGKLGILKVEATTNQAFCAMVVNDQKADYEFLFYSLLNCRNKIMGLATGAAQQNLNQDMIKSIKLPFPEHAEQSAIASILSSLDSKIELNQQMNKTLETIGKAIFKHWFTDFEFPNEEGKPYKSSGGEMVYHEELEKEIPKGWRVDILGNLCMEVTDGSHFSPKEDTEGAKVIATIKDMGLFDINLQSCKRISETDYNKLVRDGCKPEKGNILLSKDGTMGLTHIFNGQDDLVLLSSIAILRVNERFPSAYLYHYLKDRQTQSRLIEGHSSGSVLPRIVLKDLKRLSVLVPSAEALDRFDPIASSIFKLILCNCGVCGILSNIRDSFLPKLMSGKIRVPV